MAHPYASQARSGNKAKFKSMVGKARGGQVHSDEAQDRKLISKMMAQHERSEGEKVSGAKSKPRADKYARGGRTKGTKININIHGSNPQGENRALPPPLTPAALGPAAAMAPPGPSPVPGVMPGGGAPMPPPGMKRGGRIHKAEGGPMKPISKPNARSITEVGTRAYGRELGRDQATGRMGSNPYKNPAATRRDLDEEMPRKSGGRVKKDDGGEVSQQDAQRQNAMGQGQGQLNDYMNQMGQPAKTRRSARMKSGGKVKMTGGAEGGTGRLEKAKNAARTPG